MHTHKVNGQTRNNSEEGKLQESNTATILLSVQLFSERGGKRERGLLHKWRNFAVLDYCVRGVNTLARRILPL